MLELELLGLNIAIWIVLVVYLAGMLLLGWWSKRGAGNQEGYLLGNRRFGSAMMIMHSFGAGTHPGGSGCCRPFREPSGKRGGRYHPDAGKPAADYRLSGSCQTGEQKDSAKSHIFPVIQHPQHTRRHERVVDAAGCRLRHAAQQPERYRKYAAASAESPSREKPCQLMTETPYRGQCI